jgi:hypothetical protein
VNFTSTGDALALFFKDLCKYKKLFLYGNISGLVTPKKESVAS